MNKHILVLVPLKKTNGISSRAAHTNNAFSSGVIPPMQTRCKHPLPRAPRRWPRKSAVPNSTGRGRGPIDPPVRGPPL